MSKIEVKALEWEAVALVDGWNWLTIAKAETPIGRYTLDKHDKGFLRVMFGNQRVGHFDDDRRPEAEAAAQSDYDARIRSALVERSATINKIDILREWFGGERYARDYEYLDANFGAQAQSVVDYLVRLSTPPAAPVSGEAWCRAFDAWIKASRHGTKEDADKAAVAALSAALSASPEPGDEQC